ncbi:MAG: regulator [Hyphomicrobiales bacterium]
MFPRQRLETAGVKNVFGNRKITWRKRDWLQHVAFHVCRIDREHRIVDVVFKFAANRKIALHQHKTPFATFVVQGELRIFGPRRELTEIRPVGSYISDVADGEPHRKGAGDEDAIVFLSHRNVDDVMYVFFDENLQPSRTLRIDDFKAELKTQERALWLKAANGWILDAAQ